MLFTHLQTGSFVIQRRTMIITGCLLELYHEARLKTGDGIMFDFCCNTKVQKCLPQSRSVTLEWLVKCISVRTVLGHPFCRFNDGRFIKTPGHFRTTFSVTTPVLRSHILVLLLPFQFHVCVFSNCLVGFTHRWWSPYFQTPF